MIYENQNNCYPVIMKPTLSVVMPCYNDAAWLSETLTSVLQQTHRNFELICVDDGSTDQTLNILQDFARHDSRLQVFTLAHGGAAPARNFGLAHSTAPYVMFLDADDLFEPNFLATMLDTISQNNTDLVVCEHDEFNHATGQTKFTRQFKYLTLTQPVTTFNAADLNAVLFNFAESCPWNRIFKRDIIDQFNLRFQDLPCANDLFFVQAYTLQCRRLALIQQVLVHHRVNRPGSISHLTTATSNPHAHFLAAEQLKSVIPPARFPDLKDSYDNLFFKTTCYGIRRANYRQGKIIFRRARRTLQGAHLRADYSPLKWYRFCLKINNFTLLHWALRRFNRRHR